MSDNQQPTRTACCACVRNGVEGWRRASCSRSATVERDGKPYCGQHDPEAIESRLKAERAAWDAKYDRKKAARRLELAAPDLLAALKGILHIADRKAAEFEAAHAAIAKAEGAESHG